MDVFEEIYVHYKSDIYRFICRLTNYNYNLSEELLSETFYQAFLSFERFRGTCEIKTWLCQIAKNTYSGYIRKEVRRERLFEKMKETAEPEDLQRRAENQEILNCIRRILDDYDKRARDIVQYRMYAGLKFKEIGKVLGIKETTAKVIFYRTRMDIQLKLKERFGYDEM